MTSRATAALIAALAAPAALFASVPAMAQNWNAEIAATDKGFRVGDPDAPLQLIEFVSYTCPHCAHFERESEAELRYYFVHEGHAAVEIRHLIRNPVDLAAALVTECGDDDRFFDNHRTILNAQPRWMETLQGTSDAQRARWNAGGIPASMRAIASDLDFYTLMEGRGYSRSQLDQCLSDQSRAMALYEASQANAAEFNVLGTPSFVLNGTLLDGVHSWPQLNQAMRNLQTAIMMDGQ